jgi:hypothetical protein
VVPRASSQDWKFDEGFDPGLPRIPMASRAQAASTLPPSGSGRDVEPPVALEPPVAAPRPPALAIPPVPTVAPVPPVVPPVAPALARVPAVQAAIATTPARTGSKNTRAIRREAA